MENVLRLLTCPSNQSGWQIQGDTEAKMVLRKADKYQKGREEVKIHTVTQAAMVTTQLWQLATFGEMAPITPLIV